jgi:hypothetical protein
MEAMVRSRVLRSRTGACAEDLFGARPVDRRRPSLTVDKYHVVPLAVPATRDVVNLQMQTDHLAGAGRLDGDVVLLAVEIRRVVQLDVRVRSDRDGPARESGVTDVTTQEPSTFVRIFAGILL